MSFIVEQDVEEAALDILKSLGYAVIYGPDIAVDGARPERKSYKEVVLVERLKRAIDRLNPGLPREAREEALKKALRTESQSVMANNLNFHKLLTEGVDVSYSKGGRVVYGKAWLCDFDNADNNEFLAVNQYTIEENDIRRPDVLIFLNGLPVVVLELKNAADENATIWSAFNQIETYKQQIPSLFTYTEIIVISDGMQARAGTISSPKEWFLPWKKTSESLKKPFVNAPQINTLIEGMFRKERLLDLIRHFIVFEDNGEKIAKKLAAYHQYFAVNKAVKSTIAATKSDKRAGVVWHTQGSGKSLSMVFYSGKLVLQLDNPTIVVLTDRNDLDDQLFDTFGNCQSLLRQKPVQAASRGHIKELLKVASGGIVFTTIQKFFPEAGSKYPLLSTRKNIVVIADEAHRSQYDFIDGFARHMRDALPNASFIGFTGTPLEKSDRSTPAVFGSYVDVYDIEQAVEDGATVRIYYESRLAKLELKPEERPKIDPAFEEITEGEEKTHKEKLKSKWARLEKVVGSKGRIKRIADDLVSHVEQRFEALQGGKAMIVCMSRRICIELHNELIKLRPQWYGKDDVKGMLKIVMTGSATDPKEWQEHIRNKERRKKLRERMKDPSDQLKIVIVRDMWLTGFDAPSLHTMYVDKPMRSHGLMQAIARVNRVFQNKPGGLVVDYLGIADELRKALAEYTETGAKGKPAFYQEEAVAFLLEKYEIVAAMFHGFGYAKIFSTKPIERLPFLRTAANYILAQKDGKERYLKHVIELRQAFALSVPNEKALAIKDEVGFFQAVKATIVKTTGEGQDESENIEMAIQQLVSRAVVSDRVIDIFEAAGLKKPEISILSEGFLAEVKDLPQKNLAFETLKKLLQDEIRIRMRKNLIQGRSFAELLEKAIKKYTNRSIETAQVIDELVELARKMREANKRGDKLGLKEDELAFYDALEVNDSAVKVLGDEKLNFIAVELVKTIRNDIKIDWALKDSIQAEMRVKIKKILRKYGYPPDKQKKATETVLEQAKLICGNVVNE